MFHAHDGVSLTVLKLHIMDAGFASCETQQNSIAMSFDGARNRSMTSDSVHAIWSSLVATTNLKSHGEGRDVVLDKVGRGNFSLHVKSIHAWGRTAELDTVRPAAGACVEMMLLTSVVLLSRYALTFRNCSL